MIRPAMRRAIACLGVLGLVGLAILPPEHVHLDAHVDADHDHHAGPEVHRHFQPHHRPAIQTHVEPPEGDATYLDEAFLVPSPVSWHAPDETASVPADAPVVVPRGAVWHPTGRDLRVHDPPWGRAHALRGPPAQLA